MDDKILYAKLLGLTSPWGVEKVELKLKEGEVHITVALPRGTRKMLASDEKTLAS